MNRLRKFCSVFHTARQTVAPGSAQAGRSALRGVWGKVVNLLLCPEPVEGLVTHEEEGGARVDRFIRLRDRKVVGDGR
jgi:hypothetical protein